ncbi:hypothetical protein [Flavobacterium sp.]|uniref:hypothetical protein n=1 Tax=Flavobacterium sp. TaxID=239 RepID=UPI003265ED33
MEQIKLKGVAASGLAKAIELLPKETLSSIDAINRLNHSYAIYIAPYNLRATQRKFVKRRFHIAIMLLISMFVQAQDFKNISNPDEAIQQASILAAKSNNSQLLNSQNFTDENLFAVRFIPVGMSPSEYNKLDSEKQNKYLTVVYKTFDNTFSFNYITGTYDVVFDVWKNYVSNTATKDNNDKQYIDKEKRIVYLLSEDNDERWKITRQLL